MISFAPMLKVQVIMNSGISIILLIFFLQIYGLVCKALQDVKKDFLIVSVSFLNVICFMLIKIKFNILYVFKQKYYIFETMKLLRLFRRITGRKPAYAPVFAQQSTYLVQASRALVAMTETNDHSQWRMYEKEVKACEVQGDALLAEFQEQLYEDFMTAATRSDMQTIAMEIDAFLDHINDSAKSIMLYMPERIDSQVHDIAQYINAEANAIRTMMPYIGDIKRNHSQILMQCDRITELEHAADDAFAEYIGYIFTHESNAIELIKYKNIAESFETATDAAKRVSDSVRKLLMRYFD